MIDNSIIQRHIQTAIYFVIGTMYLSRIKPISSDEQSPNTKQTNKFYYSLGWLYIFMAITRLFTKDFFTTLSI